MQWSNWLERLLVDGGVPFPTTLIIWRWKEHFSDSWFFFLTVRFPVIVIRSFLFLWWEKQSPSKATWSHLDNRIYSGGQLHNGNTNRYCTPPFILIRRESLLHRPPCGPNLPLLSTLPRYVKVSVVLIQVIHTTYTNTLHCFIQWPCSCGALTL